MSDILRRIVTRFEAQPGNVRAVLGGVGGEYNRAALGARTLARDQGFLNSQLRAFGTTARYAIAGGALFGAAGTVQTLSQIQTQLGLISAIGQVSTPQGQGLLLVGDRLRDISVEARRTAVETVQPISSVNDAVINLLSTVSNVPQNQILPMVKQIGEAATLSQISVEDATKAFLTMQNAFGRQANLGNVHKTAQEFFMLTRRAPGGAAAGGQIVQQLGQLANLSRGARVSQPQLFALLTSGLQGGIPPAQISRGIQFLLQTIGHPENQTKAATAGFKSVGIDSNFIAQRGGVAALGAIFDRVKSLGGLDTSKKFQGQLSSLEDQIGEEGPLPANLISGAGGKFASTLFRRIHAFRAFTALYAEYVRGASAANPNLVQNLRAMQDAENGHTTQVEDLSKAWKRFTDQSKLPQAAIALQSLGQDMITTFEPFLNFAAGGITGLSQLANKHQDITHGIVAAGGLALLFSTLGRGLLPKIGSRALPAAALVGGLSGAKGQYAGMPGESVTNPAYVIVVSSISGPGGIFGRGKGAATTAEEEAKNIPRNRSILKNALRGGVKYSIIGTAAYYGSQLLNPQLDKLSWGMSEDDRIKKSGSIRLGSPGLGQQYIYDPNKKKFFLSGTFGQMGVSEKVVAGGLHKSVADIDRMIGRGAGGANKVVGTAHVSVDVNVKQPDGSVTVKKTGVDVNFFKGFQDTPLKAPSSRGGSKTSRG